ncbi:MAG: hemolysin family protein [Hyphomonadaceae bacterium]|nr:hemolysin family protein [Hyphomonadaceae bacterium]
MTDIPEIAPTSRSRLRALFERILKRSSAASVFEDVADALENRDGRGEMLDSAQRTMVIAAARFNEKLRAGDVMTPRADIVAIEASATLGDTARLFAESQHSRLPIYRDTLDDPIGFVHVKEVMALLAPNGDGLPSGKFSDRVLTRVKRDILFVPPSMPLPTLLVTMKSRRIHLALVIDEYGGTDGLVSIEDIVEQIVGDIEDEHDIDDTDSVLARPGGVYEADGRASVEAVEAKLGVKLGLADHEDDVETVAGLAAAIASRVPQRGEVLKHPAGFDFEVLDADPRRVKRLRIKPAPQAPKEETAG